VHVDFASSIQRDPLEASGILGPLAMASQLPEGRLGVVARIFSPTLLTAEVVLRWERDGQPLRQSRDGKTVTHRCGFRVWDALTYDDGRVPPGRYRVSVLADGRLLGSAEVDIAAEAPED